MTTVDLPRAQAGAEPQRLLTTLLGDYWYWRDEPIPSSTLVRLLGEFGISNDGARAAMRRLHARELLVLARQGRSTAYGIPERTATVIVTRTHRMMSFGSASPEWDGRWTTLAFSIPENEREVRSVLRARLRLLNFGVLYDGFWVSPGDKVDQAVALLQELDLTTASVLLATEAPDGPHQNALVNAFALDSIAASYRAFAQTYEALVERVHAGDIGPAEALVVRTDMRVAWRDFPENDPDLPAALLPADWPRDRARRCFVEIYDLLGPLAELRFRQILAVTDPDLAELASHFTSASVAELYEHINDTVRGDTPFERATAARLIESAPGRRSTRSRR